MIRAVADTHAVIWYIFNDSRLSPVARAVIEQAASAGDQIGVSSISLAEMIYLLERNRIPADTLTRLKTALEDSTVVLTEVPFDREVAFAMQQVDRAQVPELPDRIVAATAFHLKVPVITRDHKIQASNISTIW